MSKWILPSNKFSAKFQVACYQQTNKRLMPHDVIKSELMKRIGFEIAKIELPIITEIAPNIENDFTETVSTKIYVFTEEELNSLINKIIEDERKDN